MKYPMHQSSNRCKSGAFRNERGALDLSSVMVGIIVIGLIGSLIAATIFVIIPWVQDNAAKQQLTSIASAESAYMGLSSSGTNTLPEGHTLNSFGDSADLSSANLLGAAPNYCVATLADEKSYIAFSLSQTGKIWSSSDTNTKPVVFTGTIPPECDYLTESASTPYVDPTPKLTSFTYKCDVTTTGALPLRANINGTETWDDGVSKTYKTYIAMFVPTSKTLTAGVTYEVTFDGTYKEIEETAINKCLRAVKHWGSETGVTDASTAFRNATNLTDVPKHIPSTITNMAQMFWNTPVFNDPDISHWETPNVTSLSYTFYEADIFNQPLNSWDTSKVTDMSYMFSNAPSFNQAINSWNTSKVTNMYAMFNKASAFNQPLNDWDTSQVTNMGSMFNTTAAFNQPLNDWDTSKVTAMNGMFGWTDVFNQDINNWNVSNVTNMGSMFYLAKAFNKPLNSWDTSNVTSMNFMFYNASLFNQPLDKWNVSKVTNMAYMFANAYDFNQPLNGWDTSLVTTMSNMFYNVSDFNQPLNDWNVSNVTDMSNMFAATSFNQPLDKWTPSKVTTMNGMFSFVATFKQNLSGWDTTALISGTKFAHYSFPTAYLPPKTSL